MLCILYLSGHWEPSLSKLRGFKHPCPHTLKKAAGAQTCPAVQAGVCQKCPGFVSCCMELSFHSVDIDQVLCMHGPFGFVR